MIYSLRLPPPSVKAGAGPAATRSEPVHHSPPGTAPLIQWFAFLEFAATMRSLEARREGMAYPFMGRCGCDCETCNHRESDGCPGCLEAQAKMFWGECAVAKCSMAKGHDHCGQCQEFPCAALESLHQNDNGVCIGNLRAWNEMGYEVWRSAKQEQS